MLDFDPKKKEAQMLIKCLSLSSDFPLDGIVSVLIKCRIDLLALLTFASQEDVDLKTLNLKQLVLAPSVSEESHRDTLNVDHETPPKLKPEQFATVLVAVVQKIVWHELVQTTVEFGMGGIGWQLSYELMTHYFYDYDAHLNAGHWKEKVFTWFCTGLGSTAFINSALLFQAMLANFYNGLPASYYVLIAAQLCVSGTIADSLWLPFTDLAFAVMGSCGKAAIPVVGVLSLLFYLGESLVFKKIQNAIQHCHPGGEYLKFESDDEFTSRLWSSYVGFSLFPFLFREMIKNNLEQATPRDMFLSCLLACVGIMIFPLLIGLGSYAQRVVAVEEKCAGLYALSKPVVGADLENTLQEPLMTPVKELGLVQRYGWYSFFVAVNQVANRIEKTADKLLPKTG